VIRVLFLAANPLDTDAIQVGREFREIQRKVLLAEGRPRLALQSAWAVRPDDLLQALNEFEPDIVHFSGHGVNGTGELVLEDDNGMANPLSGDALDALFRNFARWVRLVVLNACHSEKQTRVIADTIGIAVGMTQAVSDKAAFTFAPSFYRALAFGRSVQDAFDQAVTALQLADVHKDGEPLLLHREDVDPQATFFDDRHSEAAIRLARDPETPERIRALLAAGSELITVPMPDQSATSASSMISTGHILLELGLRTSQARFVVQADRRIPVGRLAAALAFQLLPSLEADDYDWGLVKNNAPLSGHLSLAMADLQAGDVVLLAGNHRRPTWLPSRR
jgi:hypothetical protein